MHTTNNLDLNYTPLTEKYSSLFLVKLIYSDLTSNKGRLFGLLFLYIIIAFSWLSVLLSVLIVSSIFVLLIFFVLSIIPIANLIMYYAKKLEDPVRIVNFAKQNNIKLLQKFDDPVYPGLVFVQGTIRTINNAYIFNTIPHIEIGNFTYKMIPDERNGTSFGYIKIDTPRKLPHILFDSKNNNQMHIVSNLPLLFKNSQQLQLEGDFNEYFNLFVPLNYEKDALYLLTPDVMHVLIEKAQNYDIEIVDNQIFIYSSEGFKLNDEQTIKELLDVAMVISNKLNKQADYYSDANIANRKVDIVAPMGERLKQIESSSGIIMFVFFLTALMSIMALLFYALFTQNGKLIVLSLMGITAFSIIIAVMQKYIKYK